jgi:hypothetical protein
MRGILLAGAVSLMAVGAQAGSIDVVKSDQTTRSIEFFPCQDCKPIKAKKAAVQAVELEPGTQKIEIRRVNGEMKVFRTEAWLGGSPVVFVSKADTDLLNKQSAENKPVEDPKVNVIGIDQDTTSAVTADLSRSMAPVEQKKEIKPFDAGALQLRLN